MGVDGTGRRALLVAVAVSAAFGLAVAGWLVFGRSSPRKAATAAPALTVATNGNDSTCTRGGPPCASLNGAYQKANAGDLVQVNAGSYGGQVINARNDLNNTTCTPAVPTSCVHFTGSGVAISGSLEIHGSDLWVDGGTSRGGPYGITVSGYTDTECCPSNVIVSGVDTTSFGVFNATTVTFEDMDVGPGTITAGCGIVQGPGIENKIGSAGGVTSPWPTNITLDGLRIHDQNGDSGRINSDCHFGGLFLNTANGLLIEHTTFQGNVVYHVQIQNFGGAPVASNVTFDHDSFGCPVDWLYNGAGCDGQSSIQFDGTVPGVTIKNTAFAEGGSTGWGCYVPPCDLSTDTFGPGNTFAPASPVAPPLPGSPVTTTTTVPVTTLPTTTTTVPTTTTPTTTTPTTTVPNVPNVPLAITEIGKTLDWMHTSRKVGGLGYSIAQTKTTHAYRALVALGGTWN